MKKERLLLDIAMQEEKPQICSEAIKRIILKKTIHSLCLMYEVIIYSETEAK